MRMLRPILDVCMTSLLLLAMAWETVGPATARTCMALFGMEIDGYALGPALHEIIGTALIVLFAWHLWLDRYWIKGLLRGRWDAARALQSAVNAALIVDVVVLAVSGIMMSKGLFPALPPGSMSLAREAHMLASYWGFVLMSFHVGLYWHVARALVLDSAPRRARAWPHVVAACLMIWGSQAFVRRRIGRYMSMLEQFVFFDFEEPLWRFALDYVAVMILFACLGRYTMMLLRRTRT